MSEIPVIRISLNDEDFLTLVSGKQVDKTFFNGYEVNIILQDIGWNKMFELIYEAAGDQMDNIKEKWENARREAEKTESSEIPVWVAYPS